MAPWAVLRHLPCFLSSPTLKAQSSPTFFFWQAAIAFLRTFGPSLACATPSISPRHSPRAGTRPAANEKAIIDVLKGLREQGRTVVAVHHDLSTVREYFDDVLILNVRKVSEGPVETAFTPEALDAAYGGRLATAQIDQLAV